MDQAMAEHAPQPEHVVQHMVQVVQPTTLHIEPIMQQHHSLDHSHSMQDPNTGHPVSYQPNLAALQQLLNVATNLMPEGGAQGAPLIVYEHHDEGAMAQHHAGGGPPPLPPQGSMPDGSDAMAGVDIGGPGSGMVSSAGGDGPKPKRIVAEKACNLCQVVKPANHFSRNPTSYDGLRSHCRECLKVYRQRTAVRQPKVETKQCKLCRENLPSTNFSRKSSTADGLRGYCKQCDKSHKFEKARSKRCTHCRTVKVVDMFQQVKKGNRVIYSSTCVECNALVMEAATAASTTGLKRCRRCNEEKGVAEFNKDCTKPDGLRPECKMCVAALHAQKQERMAAVTHKECKSCHQTLPVEKFWKKNNTKDGLMTRCVDCAKAAGAVIAPSALGSPGSGLKMSAPGPGMAIGPDGTPIMVDPHAAAVAAAAAAADAQQQAHMAAMAAAVAAHMAGAPGSGLEGLSPMTVVAGDPGALDQAQAAAAAAIAALQGSAGAPVTALPVELHLHPHHHHTHDMHAHHHAAHAHQVQHVQGMGAMQAMLGLDEKGQMQVQPGADPMQLAAIGLHTVGSDMLPPPLPGMPLPMLPGGQHPHHAQLHGHEQQIMEAAAAAHMAAAAAAAGHDVAPALEHQHSLQHQHSHPMVQAHHPHLQASVPQHHQEDMGGGGDPMGGPPPLQMDEHGVMQHHEQQHQQLPQDAAADVHAHAHSVMGGEAAHHGHAAMHDHAAAGMPADDGSLHMIHHHHDPSAAVPQQQMVQVQVVQMTPLGIPGMAPDHHHLPHHHHQMQQQPAEHHQMDHQMDQMAEMTDAEMAEQHQAMAAVAAQHQQQHDQHLAALAAAAAAAQSLEPHSHVHMQVHEQVTDLEHHAHDGHVADVHAHGQHEDMGMVHHIDHHDHHVMEQLPQH